MKTFKQLRERNVVEGIGDTLAAFKAKNPGYTVSTDNKTPAQRRADTDKMLAARAAAKPKVTNQPSKPSTPEQQMKNQNDSMAASYAKHRPGQYVGDSVELEGNVVKEESDVYDKSEENKRSADAAKKQGNMFDHHMHMADHHDNLAQWHAEKGRSSMSEIHSQKSEEHHEQAMKLKEETSIAEALSAAARMQKALQKAKEDRERSERNAERLLNPVKKPAPIEQVKEENPGLYANIHAKRKRIAAGSGERMRKPGSKGAPTAKAFKQAQKTVKENIDDGVNEGIARLISKSIKNVTATKKTPQEKADIRLNTLNK